MEKFLDKINSPMDLKKLSLKDLNILSHELREFIIDNVSKTGGHIASNLGVIELTLALHYIFFSPKDKIIWDVGHQSYVHKIITGRKGEFHTLRQLGGMSGFPKTSESSHDVFNTGHSSTSISAALGIARARDLMKDKYNVIAVIGDGALTGGMAFEALNDAGRSHNNLIIILNDNEMSIAENVGGLSKYLNRIRTEPIYSKAKEDVEYVLNKIPGIGKGVTKTILKAKDGIKHMLIPGMFFEELGFKYFGPIDGHDLEALIDVLQRARNINGPVLIHICTKKGKGYCFAEEKPDTFHGISSFNIDTGKTIKISNKNFSKVFGNKMCQLAENNKNLTAITAAMITGTGLEDFNKLFSKRLYDVGIAEQHAVTFGAGLAINGIIPVIAVYSSFLQRAYDQIIHDVAMQNLHVVIAIDRAGIVGEDGETHQGIYDISLMMHVPNMTILSPVNYLELENMLEYAVEEFNGPIAIRYPRGEEFGQIKSGEAPIIYGKGEIEKSGQDLTIITYGRLVNYAIEAAKILKEKEVSAEIINLRFLKPLDKELILSSGLKTKNVIVLEEVTKEGGVSQKIESIFCEECENIKILIKALPDEFIPHGKVSELFQKYGLDVDSIVNASLDLLKKKVREQ
jgi:1-deoxy-D-xylulose-5-phosphate synthase